MKLRMMPSCNFRPISLRCYMLLLGVECTTPVPAFQARTARRPRPIWNPRPIERHATFCVSSAGTCVICEPPFFELTHKTMITYSLAFVSSF